MAGKIVWTKLGAGTLLSILIGIALVAASRWNLLPEAPDQITYDWRTYLLTERAARPRDDIAIVLVDERSLSGYPYVSPIDRGMLAELVAAVDAAGPKAIGLDLIFDRATESAKDDALAAALRQTKAPVILGAVDSRGGEDAAGLTDQEAFLARTGRPAGHLFLAPEKNRLTLGDQAVRFTLPPASEAPSRSAFARLLAEVDSPKPEPASPLIYWRKPPAGGGAELFPTFTVPAHRDGAAPAQFPFCRKVGAARLAEK